MYGMQILWLSLDMMLSDIWNYFSMLMRIPVKNCDLISSACICGVVLVGCFPKSSLGFFSGLGFEHPIP